MSCIVPAKPSNQEIIDMLFCIAPQFKTTDPDVLACYNTIINLIWCEVNWSVIYCCGLLALVYLLAHMLTLRINPNVGVTNSLKEGELSIGFAIAAGGSILNSTSYGQSYKDLIKRKVIGVAVSNLPANFNVWNGNCGGYGGGCC